MPSKVPKKIAIVLDGNRRYAKKIGLQPWKGHEFGVKKLESLFKWCIDLGIKELTLYCFSTENFKRSKKEINYLFDLFWKEFEKIRLGNSIFKDKVKVNVIGRLYTFSKKMKNAMLEAVERTKNNKALTVNFAMAYGGRQEITDAVKKVINDVQKNKLNPKKINEATITNNLYLKSDPDLVIRPGGEKRISNFLIWQSTYSELFFIDKLWPEFTKKDLMRCIEEFNRRERRFGE